MGGEVIVLGALGMFALFKVMQWRKLHRCEKCGGRLIRLGDEALSAGQRAEQELGSVRHTSRECRRCEVIFRTRKKSRIYGRDECAGCGYCTRQQQTVLVRQAEPNAPGIRRVITSCAHCDYTAGHDESFTRRASDDSSDDIPSHAAPAFFFSGTSSDSTFGSSSSDSPLDSSSSESSSFGVSPSSDTSSDPSGGDSSGGGAGSSW